MEFYHSLPWGMDFVCDAYQAELMLAAMAIRSLSIPSGHAYVETIEKLIRMTNPKVIIPMYTECAETFGKISTFAAYQDRVRVLQDGEAYCF